MKTARHDSPIVEVQDMVIIITLTGINTWSSTVIFLRFAIIFKSGDFETFRLCLLKSSIVDFEVCLKDYYSPLFL